MLILSDLLSHINKYRIYHELISIEIYTLSLIVFLNNF